MKVLEVVHGFPPVAQGGSEVYAHAHARELVDRHGDQVVVLTSEQDSSRAEYNVRTERRDGLRIVWVNNAFSRTRTFEESYCNAIVGAIAEGVIDDFAPEVAHIHHLTRLSTTVVRALSRRGIPRFVTLHDYWLMCHRGQLLDVQYRACEGPAQDASSDCGACLGGAAGAGPAGFMAAAAIRALERRLPATPMRRLRRVSEHFVPLVATDRQAAEQSRSRLAHMREVCADVTQFLAPSQYMRDQFVRFGIAPERITLARYGFDHSGFHRIERRASDRLRLGFLGSLMISKGPDLLLRAIDCLPRGAVSVDFYGALADYHGDDGYRHRLQSLLQHEAVRVHGGIAHERVPDALSGLDVLVVPSIWAENSPLVIHEAFLAGMPVVAARIGGIPEIVEDGRNGLLFRAGDADDLARNLQRLTSEPGLLDALRAGIPTVRTIEEDVRATRQLYEAHASQTCVAQDFGAAGARLKPRATKEQKAVAAIVLNYRTPDETFLAVRSLLASGRTLDDIIVVDNDADDSGTAEALHAVRQRIRYLKTGRNLGFSGGMNVGIREALARGADRVLLVNSDVIVAPDCVERLEQCLEGTPAAGIAGPVVLVRSEPDRIASLGMSYSTTTGRMRHRGFGDRLTAGDQPAAHRVAGVSGCLMMIDRKVFEVTGPLDEEFFFSFEDLDFCLRAARHGFTTLLAGKALAYHEGGGSLDAASPRRLYFAARNHLLLARRIGPAGWFRSILRPLWIVALNLAHAARWPGGSLPGRLSAVIRGVRDYAGGRFGDGG